MGNCSKNILIEILINNCNAKYMKYATLKINVIIVAVYGQEGEVNTIIEMSY